MASVLLVLDDLAAIAAVRRVMAREGHEVILATSVSDAVVSFGQYAPPLVILAPSVEGHRGQVALEELSQYPEMGRTRVVLLGEELPGLELPVVPFPLDGAMLLRAVRLELRAAGIDEPARGAAGGEAPPAQELSAPGLPEELTPSMESALFGDGAPLDSKDWELAAMSPEERTDYARSVLHEQKTDAVVAAVVEQAHQEFEAEAIASLESSLGLEGGAGIADSGEDDWSSVAPADEVPAPVPERAIELEAGASGGGAPPVEAGQQPGAEAEAAHGLVEVPPVREVGEVPVREEPGERVSAGDGEVGGGAAQAGDELARVEQEREKARREEEWLAVEVEEHERAAQRAQERLAWLARREGNALGAVERARELAQAAGRKAGALSQQLQRESAAASEALREELDRTKALLAGEAEALREERERSAALARDVEDLRQERGEVLARGIEALRKERERREVLEGELQALQGERERREALEKQLVGLREEDEKLGEALTREAEALRGEKEQREALLREVEALRGEKEGREALERQLAALREEDGKLGEALTREAEALRQEKGQREALEREVQALRAEKEHEAEQLRHERERAKKLVLHERERLAREEALLQEERGQREALEKQLQALRQEGETLGEALVREAENLRQEREQREGLEKRLEALRQEGEKLGEALVREAEASRQEREQRERLEARLEVLQQEGEARGEALAREAAVLKKEHEHREALAREVAALKKEREALGHELEKLRKEGEQLAQALAHEAEALRREKAQREARDHEVARLRQEGEQLAGALAREGEALRQEKAQREALALEVGAERAQREALAREGEALQERHAHAEKQLEQERDRARKQQAQEHEKLTHQTEALKKEREQREALADEAERLRQERERLARELEALRAEKEHEVEQLRQERERARKQVLHEREQLSRESELLQEERRQREVLARAAEAFGQERGRLEQALEALRQEAGALRPRVEALHQELEQTRAQLEEARRLALDEQAHRLAETRARQEAEQVAQQARSEAEQALARVEASLFLLPSRGDGNRRVPRTGVVKLEELARLVLGICATRQAVRLELRGGDALRILWFQGGALAAAASPSPAASLLERARRDGLIDGRQEAELRLLKPDSVTELVGLMRHRGYLREAEVVPLLQRHVEQLALDALSEPESSYRISEESLPPEMPAVVLPRPVPHLVVDALRRGLDPQAPLEAIGGLNGLPRWRQGAELEMEKLELSEREKRFLRAVDGEATVEELLRGSGLKQDAAVRLLAIARALELLDIEPGEVPEEPGAAAELDVRRLEAKFEEIQGADYFSVLGLGRTAGREEVQRAFQHLAAEFHPLRYAGHPDPSLQRRAEEIQVLLSEAAQVLQDDQLRARYARNLVD